MEAGASQASVAVVSVAATTRKLLTASSWVLPEGKVRVVTVRMTEGSESR